VTGSEYVVAHFYHSQFTRCNIIDGHLQKIAQDPCYYSTKFIKVDVENAAFFVEKLKIRVLPAVLCFKKGIVCDRYVRSVLGSLFPRMGDLFAYRRIVGFDSIGDGLSDDFATETFIKVCFLVFVICFA